MGKLIYYFLEAMEKYQIISNNNKTDEKSLANAELKSNTKLILD